MHTEQKERISCKECDSTFKAKEYIRKHMKYRHSVKDAGRWKCETCSKIFSQHGSLIVHKRIHTKEHFKCDFCSSTFVQKSARKTHIEKVHIGEFKKLVCNVCNKSFSCTTKMKGHQMTHTGEKPFSCKCGIRFNNIANLKAHAKRKGCKKETIMCRTANEAYNCDLCASSFTEKRKLLQHKKTHFLLIDCDMCDMKTSNISNMRMHRETIHKLSV